MAAALFGACLSGSSQRLSVRDRTPDEEWKFRWEGEFKLGFGSDLCEIQGGITWLPVRFLGLSCTAGVATDLSGGVKVMAHALFPEINQEGMDMEYSPTRILFQPSVVLRTPSLLIVDSWDMDMVAFAEGGPTLASYASGSVNSRWCYMRMSAGLGFVVNRFVLKLGYTLSTFDLFDGLRFDQLGTPLRSPRYTNTFSLSLGWKF